MAQSRKKLKMIGGKPITFKVKFLADCGGGKFSEGEIKEMRADRAYHYIKRGLAERCSEKRAAAVNNPPKKKPGRPKKQPEPEKVEVEEKKTEDTMGNLPSKPPITVTDKTPEMEKSPEVEKFLKGE